MDLPDLIGGTEPDGPPTLLPRLSDPDEYWTAREDADPVDATTGL